MDVAFHARPLELPKRDQNVVAAFRKRRQDRQPAESVATRKRQVVQFVFDSSRSSNSLTTVDRSSEGEREDEDLRHALAPVTRQMDRLLSELWAKLELEDQQLSRYAAELDHSEQGAPQDQRLDFNEEWDSHDQQSDQFHAQQLDFAEEWDPHNQQSDPFYAQQPENFEEWDPHNQQSDPFMPNSRRISRNGIL